VGDGRRKHYNLATSFFEIDITLESMCVSEPHVVIFDAVATFSDKKNIPECQIVRQMANISQKTACFWRHIDTALVASIERYTHA